MRRLRKTLTYLPAEGDQAQPRPYSRNRKGGMRIEVGEMWRGRKGREGKLRTSRSFEKSRHCPSASFLRRFSLAPPYRPETKDVSP